MAQSILKRYLSIPTWRDERDRLGKSFIINFNFIRLLVLEVHGNFAEINELELPCNKVSSKVFIVTKFLFEPLYLGEVHQEEAQDLGAVGRSEIQRFFAQL